MDSDARVRSAIEEHWRASESGDVVTEHAVHAEDAILDYPQSGERFRGRAAISLRAGMAEELAEPMPGRSIAEA